MSLYRCRREGCGFSTDNLGAFVEHVIGEKSPKAVPNRRRVKGSHPHGTVKEIMDCPNCYPKAESFMLAKGYRKPNLCSKCGAELVKPLFGSKYCPKCDLAL